jgi:hypothetical protein
VNERAPLLDRQIIEAFGRLGDRLARLGVVADDVLTLCAEVFPDEPVPDRARLLLEDLLADKDG